MEVARVMSEREEQALRIHQLEIDTLGIYSMFNSLIGENSLDLTTEQKNALVEGIFYQFDNLLDSVEIARKIEENFINEEPN